MRKTKHLGAEKRQKKEVLIIKERLGGFEKSGTFVSNLDTFLLSVFLHVSPILS